jgi:hypothetical protein
VEIGHARQIQLWRAESNGSCIAETSSDPRYTQRIEKDHFVSWWNDSMATCFAHLQSALSALEELAINPESSGTDAYYYDQVSASVSVALVALDACCAAESDDPRYAPPGPFWLPTSASSSWMCH